MLQWLLDGSALLVGSALLNPATGRWQPLLLHPTSQVAPGTEGRVAVLDVVEDDVPHLRVLKDEANGPSVRLPEDAPRDGRWVLAWVGEQVYVQVSSPETGEARCWRVDEAGPRELDRCVEGGFAELDRVLPAGPGRFVTESHGEGHPGVDLVEWAGAESTPLPLPWEDLYPFGPLTLLPRTDGSFDILTACPLGPPRPCLQEDGLGAEELPLRWYRWRPGEAPQELEVGVDASMAPDPSGARRAWQRGTRVCVQRPGEARRCWRIPRSLRGPPAPERP